MELSFSDIIASSAFLVSVASAYYAKSQRDVAAEAKQHDLRAHLASHHAKYQAILEAIRARHRDCLGSLGSAASEAHRHVIASVDGFDRDSDPFAGQTYVRPLRHIIHEAGEMIFTSFNGQLAWQSGLNIAGRFQRMTNAEFNLRPDVSLRKCDDWREVIRQQYYRDPNIYQETTLLSNPHFCALITTAQQRISSEKGEQLLAMLIEYMEPVHALWHSAREEILTSLRELEDAIAANNLEHFKLNNSPALWKAISRKKAQLETLGELRLPKLEAESLRHYDNYVSITITSCALLQALWSVEYWGWDTVEPF